MPSSRRVASTSSPTRARTWTLPWRRAGRGWPPPVVQAAIPAHARAPATPRAGASLRSATRIGARAGVVCAARGPPPATSRRGRSAPAAEARSADHRDRNPSRRPAPLVGSVARPRPGADSPPDSRSTTCSTLRFRVHRAPASTCVSSAALFGLIIWRGSTGLSSIGRGRANCFWISLPGCGPSPWREARPRS